MEMKNILVLGVMTGGTLLMLGSVIWSRKRLQKKLTGDQFATWPVRDGKKVFIHFKESLEEGGGIHPQKVEILRIGSPNKKGQQEVAVRQIEPKEGSGRQAFLVDKEGYIVKKLS